VVVGVGVGPGPVGVGPGPVGVGVGPVVVGGVLVEVAPGPGTPGVVGETGMEAVGEGSAVGLAVGGVEPGGKVGLGVAVVGGIVNEVVGSGVTAIRGRPSDSAAGPPN
jgi:hypothetical protein